jgi:hypothetical protein
MNQARPVARLGCRTRHDALSSPVRDPTTTFCEMASTDTKLLDILEAHGQTFLDSFKPHKAEKNKRKRAAGDTTEAHRSTKLVRAETDQSSSVGDYSDSAEEWTGFGSDAQVDDEYEIQSSAEEAVSLEGVLAQPSMANGIAHCYRGSRAYSQHIHSQTRCCRLFRLWFKDVGTVI